MRFEFATATRIVLGAGTLREVGPIAREFGHRALVVTGRTSDRAKPLLEVLKASQVESTIFTVAGEPSTEDVVAGRAVGCRDQCDLVIGFGGGSALDAAKAIAAMMTNDGELLDYLEVIGKAQPLSRPPAPCLAITTTAGTGAEVTRNAVLVAPAHRVKVSLRSPLMLPRLALVDPELTYALPPAITASTGMDALTQLIEPFVSIRANALTDGICREGMQRAARSLYRAFLKGNDAAAREDMSVASLFGGLALANAGLGAVHGFAGPIGGMFPAPHGAVCAALLPQVMDVNICALRRRMPQAPTLTRYEAIARILTGNEKAAAEDGVVWVRELTATLQIPPLSTYGIQSSDLALICEKSAVASSMKGNPITLTSEELREVLERSL